MGSRFSSIPALPRGGQSRLHRARHHHLKGTARPASPARRTPSVPRGTRSTRAVVCGMGPLGTPRWDGHPDRTLTLGTQGSHIGMRSLGTHSTLSTQCQMGTPSISGQAGLPWHPRVGWFHAWHPMASGSVSPTAVLPALPHGWLIGAQGSPGSGTSGKQGTT